MQSLRNSKAYLHRTHLYVTAYAYVTQASKSVNVRRGLSHKTEREGGRERETENSLVRVSKAQSES